jgi:predicted metal-dependent hydrolase
MTTLQARIPLVNWGKGFGRHWNGGNPVVTHAFNALSFLFPQAERFFIDVAREVAQSGDGARSPEIECAVRGFVAQESVHTSQHNRYNAMLEAQGFENVVYGFVERLQQRSHRDLAPLTKLAIVCGYEHYTAILGNFILNNPQVLEAAEPDMALIWGWHAAEETEHKAVCFDLYHAAGGGWLRRVLTFLLVTVDFNLMFSRLYFSLLYRDSCLAPSHIGRTLRQSLSSFFGASGIAWHLMGQGIRYLSPWFHPWNQDNRDQLQSWLATNQERLRKIGDRAEC